MTSTGAVFPLLGIDQCCRRPVGVHRPDVRKVPGVRFEAREGHARAGDALRRGVVDA